MTARTVNKETVAFYQVLKLANDRGLIFRDSTGPATQAKATAEAPIARP